MKTVGLIPARINSSRLFGKALIKIEGTPMVIHTYKRALKSKKLDELYICTDSNEIYEVAKQYNCQVILTGKHKTGTDRISEASRKLKKKYDFYVDIQGDEPLINPNHIDRLVTWHSKNKYYDVVVPSMKMNSRQDDPNIVKIISSNYKIIYMTRSKAPYPFLKSVDYFKHLSIISFKPNALKKFGQLKQSPIEKIESVELMRALENGFKMGTFYLNGDSFSIDTPLDLKRAKKFFLDEKNNKKKI